MGSPVREPERSRCQGVDGRLGNEHCVSGGLGELFDPGSDVDCVADQGELELASAADGAGDHHTGVDPDADPKRAVKALGDAAGNLLTGPPASTTAGTTISNNALRRATVSSAVFDSANGVKSRTSTNITVPSRRSPVKTSSPCSSSRAANAGST